MRHDRVLVTGADGFIGSALVRRLLEVGTAVVAPGHGPADEPADGLERPAAALEDVEALVVAMRGCGAVVHLAARAGGIQFQATGHAEVLEDNTRATRSVLEAAARAGVARVFLASSGVVYAPEAASPIPEEGRLVRPDLDRVTGYAWSKLTDEAVAGWYAGRLDCVVGRFTNTYGPGGSFDPARSTVVHALVARAADLGAGEALAVWGDGSAVRSFLYVEDAVEAVLAVLDRGERGRAYNLDSSEPVAIRELAHLVREAVAPGADLAFDASKPAGSPVRVLDNARLRALGFAPQVPLSEGVHRTAAAFRARR